MIDIDVQTAPPARAGDLWSTLTGRRSVRAFTPEQVPREVILRAVEAAGWAPSPHGRQPWRFVVVESAAARRRLADDMAATWTDQLALDGQGLDIVAIRRAKSQERLVSTPCLILPCLYVADLDRYPDADRTTAEFTMAVQSIGAAIQNLLLSVYADGYDAGWMCAPLFCPDIVRTSLGLDAALDPHAIITVGVAAKDPARRPGRPVEDLIATWLTD